MLILSLFEYFTYIIINKKNNTNLLYLTKTKITNLNCLKNVIQLSTRTEGLFQKVWIWEILGKKLKILVITFWHILGDNHVSKIKQKYVFLVK